MTLYRRSPLAFPHDLGSRLLARAAVRVERGLPLLRCGTCRRTLAEPRRHYKPVSELASGSGLSAPARPCPLGCDTSTTRRNSAVTAATDRPTAMRVHPIAIGLIDPSDDNHRRHIGDVSDLAQSIRHHGLLQPLVVRPRGDRYQLVAGARRLAALTLLSWPEVPAIVRDLEDVERREAMLVENIQRENLTPLDEAAAFQELLDLGAEADALAERVGRRPEQISSRAALLRLPSGVRKKLAGGGINLTEAQLLLRLVDEPHRIKAAMERYTAHGWSMAQAVDSELRQKAVEERAASSLAALEKRSVAVIEAPTWDHVDGRSPYRRLGKGFGELDIRVSAHAKEPCHAACVSKRTGEAIHICTEPRRHRPDASPAQSIDRRAERASARSEAKALKEATAQRTLFLTQLANRRPDHRGDGGPCALDLPGDGRGRRGGHRLPGARDGALRRSAGVASVSGRAAGPRPRARRRVARVRRGAGVRYRRGGHPPPVPARGGSAPRRGARHVPRWAQVRADTGRVRSAAGAWR